MRLVINLIVFIYSFTVFSQRITVEDPELTFSFFKPKNWVLVDDGYVIKVSPLMRDTATTYMTITYFDQPEPQSNEAGTHFTTIELETPAKNEFKSYMITEDRLKILGFDVRPKRSLTTKMDIPLERRFYEFYRLNKNWEVVTSAHADQFEHHNKTFKKILKSLRID